MQNVTQKVSRTSKAASSNPALQSALAYRDICLRVILLGERSKQPIIPNWPEAATTDRETIIGWYKDRPNNNIGIATGRGIVAIDVDVKHGADGLNSLKELIGGRALPETAVARTGTGGFHYLFRVRNDVKVPSRRNLMPGIDIRADGGQIVVEPSIHPDGGHYEWIRRPEDGIAPAPEWLVNVLLAPPESKGPGRKKRERSVRPGLVRDDLKFDITGDVPWLTREMIEKYPVTAKGQRNELLYSVIGSLLGRRFTFETTERVAMAWWEHFYGLGTIGTNPSEAPREIRYSIEYRASDENFEQCSYGAEYHFEEVRNIELTEEQRNKIIQLINSSLTNNLLLNTINSTNSEKRVRLYKKLHGFVEALVIHFSHEVDCKPDGPLKATREQITQIMRERHGLDLKHPTQFERLMRMFVTRPGKPASLCELAVQTVKGRTGVPSEYQLTGLREFLEASPEGLA